MFTFWCVMFTYFVCVCDVYICVSVCTGVVLYIDGNIYCKKDLGSLEKVIF